MRRNVAAGVGNISVNFTSLYIGPGWLTKG